MHIFNSPRLSERRDGIHLFNEFLKDKSKCLVIHYSCESFITNHGNTPRVTSICVKSIGASQTKSFSIHLQAQFEKLDFNNLSDKEYDSLELSMLNEFSGYVTKHSGYKWVHWHMRNSNYGFEAINNRIRILNGTTFEIDDDRKYDLPDILGLIFTYEFEHDLPHGKLLNLAERNNVNSKNALTGGQEAEAFDNKEYLKLHMSTLRKVDIIESIIHRTKSEDLKVSISKKQIYGLSLRGIIALVKATPWMLLIATVFGYFLKVLIDFFIKKTFHIQ